MALSLVIRDDHGNETVLEDDHVMMFIDFGTEKIEFTARFFIDEWSRGYDDPILSNDVYFVRAGRI